MGVPTTAVLTYVPGRAALGTLVVLYVYCEVRIGLLVSSRPVNK